MVAFAAGAQVKHFRILPPMGSVALASSAAVGT